MAPSEKNLKLTILAGKGIQEGIEDGANNPDPEFVKSLKEYLRGVSDALAHIVGIQRKILTKLKED